MSTSQSRQDELNALRDKGMTSNLREKYRASTSFMLPEEAEVFLSEQRAKVKSSAAPTPPNKSSSADLNNWYSSQRKRDLEERKRREEAEAFLRGYRSSAQLKPEESYINTVEKHEIITPDQKVGRRNSEGTSLAKPEIISSDQKVRRRNSEGTSLAKPEKIKIHQSVRRYSAGALGVTTVDDVVNLIDVDLDDNLKKENENTTNKFFSREYNTIRINMEKEIVSDNINIKLQSNEKESDTNIKIDETTIQKFELMNEKDQPKVPIVEVRKETKFIVDEAEETGENTVNEISETGSDPTNETLKKTLVTEEKEKVDVSIVPSNPKKLETDVELSILSAKEKKKVDDKEQQKNHVNDVEEGQKIVTKDAKKVKKVTFFEGNNSLIGPETETAEEILIAEKIKAWHQEIETKNKMTLGDRSNGVECKKEAVKLIGEQTANKSKKTIDKSNETKNKISETEFGKTSHQEGSLDIRDDEKSSSRIFDLLCNYRCCRSNHE